MTDNTEDQANNWTYSNAGGINLLNFGPTPQNEIDRFRETEIKTRGFVLPTFEFWLRQNSAELKRLLYTIPAWTHQTGPGQTPRSAIGYIGVYGFIGFTQGVLYEIDAMEAFGHPKADVLEAIAFLYLYSASGGFAEVAEVVEKRLQTYREPAADRPRPVWPEGWACNPDQFKCGLDYSDPRLSPAELKQLEGWYETYMGEVPRSVRFLAKYEPLMLKAWRLRFENAVGSAMPNQMMPWMMICFESNRHYEDGIREAVQLAKGFGMTRELVIEALMWGIEYGGVATFATADRACGDLLEKW